MPFTVTQIPGEPIVIAQIEVPLEQHMASIKSVTDQLARLAATSSPLLFVLVDLRDQSLSFSDILIGMEILNAPPNWLAQPTVRTVLVGTDPMIGIALKRFKQQLGVDLTRFETIEDALAYARAEINRLNE
jgi:hypothetical protein